MTPFDPRSSYRAILAAILISGGALVVGATFRDAVPAAMFAGGLVALDGLVLLLRRPLREGEVSASLFLEPESRGPATVRGGVARLRLAVESRSGGRLTVHPLLPPGARPLAPPAAVFRPAARDAGEFAVRCRLERVGVLVFPGVLFEAKSPLHLFRRRRFVPARRELAVAPDFTASVDPVVARAMQSSVPAEAERRRAVKGDGADFAELRPYRAGDPERRVDWKATARRGALHVREYASPREFTVRVILDASVALSTRDGFARAADLVAKLAFVAATRRLSFELLAVDRGFLTRRTLVRPSEFPRVVADLMALPRAALLRSASGDELFDRAYATWRRSPARFGGDDFESFLEQYRPGAGPDAAAFLADFDPAGLGRRLERCDGCRIVLADDDASCVRCGRPREGDGRLAPRAAALAAALAGALRRSRGREMFVLISAFGGGETAPPISAALALACAPRRTVHVVAPDDALWSDVRAEPPGTLGAYPSAEQTAGDADVLRRADERHSFRRRVEAAGAAFHSLDDDADRDRVVLRLLRAP